MSLRRAGRASSLAADRQWRRERRAGGRWALGGIAIGALVGLIGWAPASWLAAWVQQLSAGHLLLADAEGTVWNGDAVLLLTGGAGSTDASALPGRLSWSLRPLGWGLALHARQPCCLDGELALRLWPRWSGYGIQLVAPAPAAGGAPARIGQWPASWLSGLGTPWNTLQLGGLLRLASPGLELRRVGNHTLIEGMLQLDADDLASRVSPLQVLGSYRLRLDADAAGGESARIVLETRSGALQLSGRGQWSARGLQFRGQAQAAPGQEAMLSNLLNLIGRREGALSLISIG
jgi:general secretion pathway protein N